MGSATPARVRVERGIYRQRNGKYAVCWRHAGRLRVRTVGFDVAEARRARLALIAATREGKLPVSPRLRFEAVAGWWLDRFEAKVAAGERHPRTLEAHRYQLDRHLLPALGRRRVASLTVDDVAELLHELRRTGRSAKTAASALATLQSVMRFAPRCGWSRRPGRAARARRAPAAGAAAPARARARRDRAPARGLLGARPADARHRPLHRPAHLRDARPRLGRRRLRGRRDPRAPTPLARPPRRARLLSAHRQRSRFARGADWVFATARGTPYGHRNVGRRCLGRAAQLAGLNDDGRPPLRFHDLRHTFASHLIIDLGLDPAQVSRMLGHARITITLDTYTHTCSRTPATRKTSGPAWPPAHSPACSSPPHPPPAPRCSSSDRTRDPRSNELTHAVAHAPNVPQAASRLSAPWKRPRWWRGGAGQYSP
jgi:integrase